MLCRNGLAVALGQRLVVLHGLLGGAGPDSRSSSSGGGGGSAPSVDFVSAVDAPESLTTLAWLAAGGAQAAGGPGRTAAWGAYGCFRWSARLALSQEGAAGRCWLCPPLVTSPAALCLARPYPDRTPHPSPTTSPLFPPFPVHQQTSASWPAPLRASCSCTLPPRARCCCASSYTTPPRRRRPSGGAGLAATPRTCRRT